jgi:hypothetical protein
MKRPAMPSKKAGAASTSGPVRIDQSGDAAGRNHNRAMSGRPPMTSRVHVGLIQAS